MKHLKHKSVKNSWKFSRKKQILLLRLHLDGFRTEKICFQKLANSNDFNTHPSLFDMFLMILAMTIS